jgi:hypothetical protein
VYFDPARQHLDLTQVYKASGGNGSEAVNEDQVGARLRSAAAHVAEHGLDD